MNAPTTKEAITRMLEGSYELLPLSAVTPSETHIQQLRRKRYDMESLADLRASVGKLGVQQPVVVRKLAAMRGLASYELVAGERRYKAAGLAGLSHIPAMVRALNDEQVLEVQLVENLQREDLHPLEEAAGYEELMKVGKLKKEDLGEKVGKSRSWVYSRMNLLKLPKHAQDFLQDGRLDVSRALVVASVADEALRDQVLEMALQRTHDNNPTYSVRQLRAKTLKDRLTFPLVGAPFPTDDATLFPTAGDCRGCQYRTGNCDPEAADPDVCTNVPCYHHKVKTHGDNRRAAVIAGGGKVLRGEDARKISPSVNTCYGHVDLDLVCEHDDFPESEPDDVDYEKEDSDPRMVAWRSKEEAWQPRTYRALLAGQTYPSVLIDDPKTKQLRELVPFKVAQTLLKKVKIDLPSYANKQRQSFTRGGSSSGGGGSSGTSPAEKAKQEAATKAFAEDEAIQKATLQRTLEQVKAKHEGKLTIEDLVYLAGPVFGDLPDEITEPLCKWYGLKDPGYRWEKALEKLSSKDLPVFIALGIVGTGLTEGYAGSEEAAESVCKRLKIDRKKIEADVRAEFKAKAKPEAKPAAKAKGKKK